MSGIAIEALTMPGRQATFITCPRHGSSRIDSISFSDANTRPGTRIAPDCGTSYSHSESWTRAMGDQSVLGNTRGRQARSAERGSASRARPGEQRLELGQELHPVHLAQDRGPAP